MVPAVAVVVPAVAVVVVDLPRASNGEAVPEKKPEKDKRKESLVMRDTFKVEARRWFVVGGLLLLMSITSLGYAQPASLTEPEKDWLTYMREEEKLARDVYIVMHELWGSTIFANIAASEQRHMDAVKSLLDKYGLRDPASGSIIGKFTDTFLQALYDDLKEQGSVSLVEALKVGVFIEKTDIHDLHAASALTTRRHIKKVYSNLLQGSYSHLDAFCSDLERLGVTNACE